MNSKLRQELEAMKNLQTGDSFTAEHVHTLVDGILEGGGEFKYVNYDSTSFPYPQTIGDTANSIVGLGNADETMIGTIFIMPNKETDSTATMMIVVDEKEPSTDPKTYQYIYVGNINDLPSDVLTEGSIVNDLSTGGTDKPLSAEQGRTLNSHVNYTTCGSNAGDQVKLISDDGFELSTHLRLLVRMTNTNTHATPKFNINNTGVKDVWYNGAVASDTNTWAASEVLDVYYDGSDTFVATTHGGAQFSTGEKVGDVGFDDTHLKNISNSSIVKGEDAMLLSSKLEKVSLTEEKYNGAYLDGYVRVSDGGTPGSGPERLHIEVTLNGEKRIRFLGYLYVNQNAVGYGFYNSNGPMMDYMYPFDNDTSLETSTLKEYIIEIPEGATVFKTTINSSSANLLRDNFYCYLQKGSVAASEDDLVDNCLNNINVTFIGDSISGFKGNYDLAQYPFYPYGNVTSVDKTWWWKFIQKTGATLKENLSCSSAFVSVHSTDYSLLTSVQNAQNTDILILSGGQNDSGYTVPIGTINYEKETSELDDTKFFDAYLHQVRIALGKASKEVICVITSLLSNAYANVIIGIANYYNLTYIDCREIIVNKAATSHPNYQGMMMMCEHILSRFKNSRYPKIDETPTQNSKNPVSSGGVYTKFEQVNASIEQVQQNLNLEVGTNSISTLTLNFANTGKFISNTGIVGNGNSYAYTDPILISKGTLLALKAKGASISCISYQKEPGYNVFTPLCTVVGGTPAKWYYYLVKQDMYITICSSIEDFTPEAKIISNEILNKISENHIGIITNYLNNLYVEGKTLLWNEIPAIEGYPSANGFLFEQYDYGTHKVIPVKSGDSIKIAASSRTYYAFVKTYSLPIFGNNSIDFSSIDSSVHLATSQVTATAPSDANYIIIVATHNEYTWSPNVLVINNKDYFESVDDKISELSDEVKNFNTVKFDVYLDWSLIDILPGNLDNGIIRNLNSLPTVNGHRQLPVKPNQTIKVYPSANRVGIALVKQINSDSTFTYASGYSSNIVHGHSDGPIEVTVPFDCKYVLFTEYYTSGSTTYHWYAEDVLIDGESIVNSQKNENLIWKNRFIENMLLGGDTITPVEFTYAIPSGGDTDNDGNVCVGYYSGTTRYNEYSGDRHAGLTTFNMLNPLLTQESYKALKDGDVVMWNHTGSTPDPNGESTVWRGMGIGDGNPNCTDTCAKFIDSSTIRVLTNGGNCLTYIDFNRITKQFETTEYQGQTINVGHMILLKIGDTYYKSDITTTNVDAIIDAISAIDSRYVAYESTHSMASDCNPTKLGDYYYIVVAIGGCGCIFKSTDLKVFEFVTSVPCGYMSREVEFAAYSNNTLYGIVRGWKNAFPEVGGYSQLFTYNVANDTFSEFVELTGLCGERPAIQIINNKLITINRVGNGSWNNTSIQRANKLLQVFDLNFNLLNSLPLNFIRGCNTIQFIRHTKHLYAFVSMDKRGFVFTKSAEGRNDICWTYIDTRYFDK